jgi:hypothetical protein
MDSDDIPEAHGTKHTFNNASSSADVPILIPKTLLKGDLRSPERIHCYRCYIGQARDGTVAKPKPRDHSRGFYYARSLIESTGAAARKPCAAMPVIPLERCGWFCGERLPAAQTDRRGAELFPIRWIAFIETFPANTTQQCRHSTTVKFALSVSTIGRSLPDRPRSPKYL